MAWHAQPGTIAFRVIEALKRHPAGTELPGATLSELLDVESSVLGPCMRPAVEAGVVAVRKRPETGNIRVNWWSLGNGKPVRPPVIDGEDPGPQVVQRVVDAASAPPMKPASIATFMLPPAVDPEPEGDVEEAVEQNAVADADQAVVTPGAGAWSGPLVVNAEEKPEPQLSPEQYATLIGAEAEAQDDELDEFDYCLFRNGTLQVWGLQLHDDGSVSITREQLQELRGPLAWLPVRAGGAT